METLTSVGVAIISFGVVMAFFAVARMIRRTTRSHDPFPPVEIARVVDHGIVRQSAAGASALILTVCSAVALMKYFAARTTDQQIVALLLWIGNCVFWGSFMLAAMISSGRKSTIYRDEASPERREPVL